MTEVTATEASRRFADLLDGVEHRGERYTIVRRGRVIAQLEPAATTAGADAKALLRRHRIDRAWATENDALRDGLTVEERF
ncbi:MAG: type II toxin-antitoxin system prevent-host-death family antitoxin [Ilumatobacteraceae bacterium]